MLVAERKLEEGYTEQKLVLKYTINEIDSVAER
jgi:hypothetical protein